MFVLELVRQRRLMERYSLLWLFSALILLLLAVWRDLLIDISEALGIFSPVNALFGAALVFVLALLLHFSTIISRLADQNKILAQKAAQLENKLDDAERDHTPEPVGPQ